MFDSPLEWCDLCKQWVAIDESLAECARKHHCQRGSCPLAVFLKSGHEPRPGAPGNPELQPR